MSAARTVWVTKYALTRGILQAKELMASFQNDGLVRVRWPEAPNNMATLKLGIDAFRSLPAAEARVAYLIDAKLASLENQAQRLRDLRSTGAPIIIIGASK